MDIHRSMSLFIEIARQGNLTAAGQKLGMSPPSASRRLADLESWLGHPLVRRSTRHVSLTELGERYLPKCIEIVESTEALRKDAAQLSDEPSGRLKVTAAGIVARRAISQVIPGFLEKYPSVTLQMELSNRLDGLIEGQTDLAIRIGHIEDSSLISRKLCDTRTVLVASPAFLDKWGRPQDISDLQRFPCLVDTIPRYGARWPFLSGKMVQGPAFVGDGEITGNLAVSGMGLAYLPELLISAELRDGRLEEVLTDVAPAGSAVYAVFPARDYITPGARAFAQAIETHLRTVQ